MLVLPATAQDYAREKRWADEFVPALVVGEAALATAISARLREAMPGP